MLAFTGIILVIFYAVIGFVGPRTPRLGIDLQGGTQETLTASSKNQQVTPDKMNAAVNIIRDRVNAFGVSESQVNTQGSNNIVVSLPGKNQQTLLNQIGQSAVLNFRVVLLCTAPTAASTASPTPSATGAAGSPSPTTSHAAAGAAAPSPTKTAVESRALIAAPTATAPATPAATPAGAPTTTPGATTTPSATPKPTSTSGTGTTNNCYTPLQQDSGSPPTYAANLVNPAAAATAQLSVPSSVYQQYESTNCSDPATLQQPDPNPSGTAEVVACDQGGGTKYLLAQAAVHGVDVTGASAQLQTDSQGNSTGVWQVVLTMDGKGADAFRAVTTTLATSQNQFAITLDNQVVSAPTVNGAIPNGQAVISGGSINANSARNLADILKYGALPITLTPLTVDSVSPTLAGSQLSGGLLAGAIGLILVVLYAVLYYRGLAIVAVFSLVCAAAFTYAIAVLLGPVIGFTLSLPGVAGLVVAIGITADSFVVYFERIRDEVREGRSLRTAVEHGWTRARRTILVADFVSFLAAAVLYIVSIDEVRGFAFTLGLTTLIDVVVVFLFTKPLITILARTRFFSGGHRWSGLDPSRLGGRQRPRSVVRGRQGDAAKEA